MLFRRPYSYYENLSTNPWSEVNQQRISHEGRDQKRAPRMLRFLPIAFISHRPFISACLPVQWEWLSLNLLAVNYLDRKRQQPVALLPGFDTDRRT